MKRFLQLAFLKALVITVGSDLIYVLYGYIAGKPFDISLGFNIIFFVGIFITSLIEYAWSNRKK